MESSETVQDDCDFTMRSRLRCWPQGSHVGAECERNFRMIKRRQASIHSDGGFGDSLVERGSFEMLSYFVRVWSLYHKLSCSATPSIFAQ